MESPHDEVGSDCFHFEKYVHIHSSCPCTGCSMLSFILHAPLIDRPVVVCLKSLTVVQVHTVIAEIFIRVKILYSSVRELSYAINIRTARTVSHTLLYVHGFVCY